MCGAIQHIACSCLNRFAVDRGEAPRQRAAGDVAGQRDGAGGVWAGQVAGTSRKTTPRRGVDVAAAVAGVYASARKS